MTIDSQMCEFLHIRQMYTKIFKHAYPWQKAHIEIYQQYTEEEDPLKNYPQGPGRYKDRKPH